MDYHYHARLTVVRREELVRIQRPSHHVTGDRRDGVKGIGDICLRYRNH